MEADSVLTGYAKIKKRKSADMSVWFSLFWYYVWHIENYFQLMLYELAHFPSSDPAWTNTDLLITPLKASLSLIHHLAHTHHYPPLCFAYSHAPAFCSSCWLHHSIHPALPPTWLFLPCLAQDHPAEGCDWDGSVCVYIVKVKSECLRGRGGEGGGGV